jgi:hypothetical protein
MINVGCNIVHHAISMRTVDCVSSAGRAVLRGFGSETLRKAKSVNKPEERGNMDAIKVFLSGALSNNTTVTLPCSLTVEVCLTGG